MGLDGDIQGPCTDQKSSEPKWCHGGEEQRKELQERRLRRSSQRGRSETKRAFVCSVFKPMDGRQEFQGNKSTKANTKRLQVRSNLGLGHMKVKGDVGESI